LQTHTSNAQRRSPHEHRAVARQNAEVVPGLAGDSFWPDYRSLGEGSFDFSCFVCIKARYEMGFGAKPRRQIDRTELSHWGRTRLKYGINYLKWHRGKAGIIEKLV